MAPKQEKPVDKNGDNVYFKTDKLNRKELRLTFGIAPATITANPELDKLLKKIIAEKITDRDTQLALLKGTDWWQKNTTDYLAMEKARAEKPELWQALVERTARDMQQQFSDAGATLSDADAKQVATKFLYTSGYEDGQFVSYDKTWLNKQIASMLDFSNTNKIGDTVVFDMKGKAEETAKSLYDTARAYGMDTSMSNQGFTSWFKKSMTGLIDGTIAPQDVDDELVSMAASRFPGMQQQLAAGRTLKDAADPYLTAIADELDMDPSMIDLSDPLVGTVLNNVDEQGNFKPMNLYQARQRARADERWKYSGKAKEEYTSMASSILRDFGFLG